ncbi:hypothetical protein BH10PSE2_BH10PSE2_30680 [soil metagenome]
MFTHVACWNLPSLHRAIAGRPESGCMAVSASDAAVLRKATGLREVGH